MKMKYRGKYNLKENLFRGRGMGLLKESSNAWQGDYTEIIAAAVAGGANIRTEADVLANLPPNASAQDFNQAIATGKANGAKMDVLFQQAVAMGQTAANLAKNMGGCTSASWTGRTAKGGTTGDISLSCGNGETLEVSLKSSQKGTVSSNLAYQGNFGFEAEMPTEFAQIKAAGSAELKKAGYTDSYRKADGKGDAVASKAAQRAMVQTAKTALTDANIRKLLGKLLGRADGVVVVGPNGVIPGGTSNIAVAMGDPNVTFSAVQSAAVGKRGEFGFDIMAGEQQVAKIQGPRYSNPDQATPRMDVQPR